MVWSPIEDVLEGFDVDVELVNIIARHERHKTFI